MAEYTMTGMDMSSDSSSDDDDNSTSSDCTSDSSEDEKLELVQVKGTRIHLPQGLCDKEEVFREFFSPDVLNAFSHEQKLHLSTLLPTFPEDDELEKDRTLDMLFSGEEFRFSSPLNDFFQQLKKGHFQPDIARMKKQIKAAERKEARIRHQRYRSQLKKDIAHSRENLLRDLKGAPPGGINQQIPKASTSSYISPIAYRTKRRYFQHLEAIRLQVGQQDFSSDENYPEETVSKRRKRTYQPNSDKTEPSDALQPTITNSVTEFLTNLNENNQKSKQSKNQKAKTLSDANVEVNTALIDPLDDVIGHLNMEDHCKSLLVEHKKVRNTIKGKIKLEVNTDPVELNTNGISITDVIQRTKLIPVKIDSSSKNDSSRNSNSGKNAKGTNQKQNSLNLTPKSNSSKGKLQQIIEKPTSVPGITRLISKPINFANNKQNLLSKSTAMARQHQNLLKSFTGKNTNNKNNSSGKTKNEAKTKPKEAINNEGLTPEEARSIENEKIEKLLSQYAKLNEQKEMNKYESKRSRSSKAKVNKKQEEMEPNEINIENNESKKQKSLIYEFDFEEEKIVDEKFTSKNRFYNVENEKKTVINNKASNEPVLPQKEVIEPIVVNKTNSFINEKTEFESIQNELIIEDEIEINNKDVQEATEYIVNNELGDKNLSYQYEENFEIDEGHFEINPDVYDIKENTITLHSNLPEEEITEKVINPYEFDSESETEAKRIKLENTDVSKQEQKVNLPLIKVGKSNSKKGSGKVSVLNKNVNKNAKLNANMSLLSGNTVDDKNMFSIGPNTIVISNEDEEKINNSDFIPKTDNTKLLTSFNANSSEKLAVIPGESILLPTASTVKSSEKTGEKPIPTTAKVTTQKAYLSDGRIVMLDTSKTANEAKKTMSKILISDNKIFIPDANNQKFFITDSNNQKILLGDNTPKILISDNATNKFIISDGNLNQKIIVSDAYNTKTINKPVSTNVTTSNVNVLGKTAFVNTSQANTTNANQFRIISSVNLRLPQNFKLPQHIKLADPNLKLDNVNLKMPEQKDIKIIDNIKLSDNVKVIENLKVSPNNLKLGHQNVVKIHPKQASNIKILQNAPAKSETSSPKGNLIKIKGNKADADFNKTTRIVQNNIKQPAIVSKQPQAVGNVLKHNLKLQNNVKLVSKQNVRLQNQDQTLKINGQTVKLEGQTFKIGEQYFKISAQNVPGNLKVVDNKPMTNLKLIDSQNMANLKLIDSQNMKILQDNVQFDTQNVKIIDNNLIGNPNTSIANQPVENHVRIGDQIYKLSNNQNLKIIDGQNIKLINENVQTENTELNLNLNEKIDVKRQQGLNLLPGNILTISDKFFTSDTPIINMQNVQLQNEPLLINKNDLNVKNTEISSQNLINLPTSLAFTTVPTCIQPTTSLQNELSLDKLQFCKLMVDNKMQIDNSALRQNLQPILPSKTTQNILGTNVQTHYVIANNALTKNDAINVLNLTQAVKTRNQPQTGFNEQEVFDLQNYLNVDKDESKKTPTKKELQLQNQYPNMQSAQNICQIMGGDVKTMPTAIFTTRANTTTNLTTTNFPSNNLVANSLPNLKPVALNTLNTKGIFLNTNSKVVSVKTFVQAPNLIGQTSKGLVRFVPINPGGKNMNVRLIVQPKDAKLPNTLQLKDAKLPSKLPLNCPVRMVTVANRNSPTTNVMTIANTNKMTSVTDKSNVRCLVTQSRPLAAVTKTIGVMTQPKSVLNMTKSTIAPKIAIKPATTSKNVNVKNLKRKNVAHTVTSTLGQNVDLLSGNLLQNVVHILPKDDGMVQVQDKREGGDFPPTISLQSAHENAIFITDFNPGENEFVSCTESQDDLGNFVAAESTDEIVMN